MSGLAPSLESAVGNPLGSIKAKSAKQEPYAALPHGQSIRMLILESAAIDSAGSYEALSYIWGTSEQVDSISIRYGNNEWLVDLTASLNENLLRLRFSDNLRRLWVDHICINQPDVAERSQQVPLVTYIIAKKLVRRSYRIIKVHTILRR